MRNSSHIILIILLLVVGFSIPAAGQEYLTLTLQDAISHALKHNEDFLIAQTEQRKADAEVARARADVFPQLRFHGDYTRSFEIPTQFVTIGNNVERFKFGFEHGVNWGFTATQSLFKGGRMFAAWSAARLYAKYTRQVRRQALLDLQYTVAQTYYDAYLAEQAVTVAQQSLTLAEETLDVVQKKYEEGAISEYDLLRAEVQVANIKPKVLQAENNRDLAYTALRNILGIEGGRPLALQLTYPDSAVWEDDELSALIDLADTARPELMQAELEVEMRERAVTVARSERLPSLELSGRYNVSAYRETFGFDSWQRTPSWTATLSLSMPIFEGFRIKSNISNAQADLTQAELRHQSIYKQLTLEIEQAQNNLREATERLASQAETVDQAERGYEIAELRYREGIGTQLEVTDARLALTTARLNHNTALRDVLVSRAALRRAVGQPVLNEFSELPD